MRLSVEPLEERSVPAVLLVGPTEPFSTVAAAAAAAGDGDTIRIDAGTYTGTGIIGVFPQSNLTIECVNGMARLDATGLSISNRKGIFVIGGNNTTVKNIEFSGAHDPVGADKNWAGIRQEGSTLTVSGCYFHNNDDGMLVNAGATSNIVVAYSQFASNGYGDGFSHNMYIGNVNSFTLEYSYTHDANQGHDLKSRANTNYVLYNWIGDTGAGSASYELSMPNGGTAYVVGNVIRQDSDTTNGTIVDWGSEGATNPSQGFFLVNNTVVNDRSAGAFVRLAGTTSPVRLVNNLFAGAGAANTAVYSGPTAEQSNNYVGANPGFVGPATFDYHLSAGSAAINSGTNPGSANGVALAPTNQYVAVANTQARPTDATLDAGAFEYVSAGPALPAAPSNLAASTSSATQVNLAWVDNASNETGFVIDVALDNGFAQIVQTLNAAADVTSVADAGLTSGVAYFYRVRAVNAAGASANSNAASATTLPDAPVGVSASGGTNAVTIRWTASGGASSYDVFRSTVSGGEGTTPYAAGVTGTSFLDSTVNAGTQYYYQIVAVDAGGRSPLSSEVSATPLPAAPSAPTGVAAAAGDASVTVTWSPSARATSYNVYRATSAGGEGSTPFKTGVNGTSFADAGLANGTTYYYRITAVNAGGESGASVEVSATPRAATGLPAPWVDGDIGGPLKVGAAAYSNGTFTVGGGGRDIGSRSDQFNYAHQSFGGNGSIVALVGSQQNTNGSAKAGVMWRNGTVANAAFVDVVVTPTNGLYVQWRSVAGGSTSSYHVKGLAAPKWVKLVRAGDAFTAFSSADGSNWTQLGVARTIKMSPTAEVGLAVTSHNTGAISTATFSGVSVTVGG